MSVNLKTADGDVFGTSNGEWLAITAMGWAFHVLEKPWSSNHDEDVSYSPGELRALASRAEQIGKAAGYLREMADAGGVVGIS